MSSSAISRLSTNSATVFAQGLADAIDHLHHGVIALVLEHVAHKAAIDLEVVDGQLLQIGQRRHADTEIIEGKAAAQGAQRLNQPRGIAEVADGAGFGDFSTASAL